MLTEPPPENAPPITELSRQQRRVLGVLLEKAFTTPEQYPLTPKSLTTGCNQKSNRSPLVNYDETLVLDTLDELRQLGLVGQVHTDSGRTERYRHYARHRFSLSEPQLAILTELMLRGRQRLGELRIRASRMVPIDSLEQLREALNGLIKLKLLQTTGDLERRGTEVDHNLYRAKENAKLEQDTRPLEAAAAPRESSAETSPRPASADHSFAARLSELAQSHDELWNMNLDLKEQLETLRADLAQVQQTVEQMRRDLGG